MAGTKSGDPEEDAFEIVCLGTAEWHVVHSIAEYTMDGFARDRRVLFVEPFGSWITLRRVARWQRRKRERRPGLEQVGPMLWVYRPPPVGLPGISRWRWAAEVNGWMLALLLRRTVRKLGFRRPVLWSYLYSSGAVLRNFPAALAVYEAADNDLALATSGRQRGLMAKHRAATCRAADLVLACTAELADMLRPENPDTHEVNCAADLDFWGQALQRGGAVPGDIARLQRPVIGYVGGVDPWKMDLALLRAIATAHPEWSIALVGYIWYGFDAGVFAGCRNIHLLGPKAYETLPSYMRAMDVCMMPFPLNGITRYGDALKAYEYLAAGRPVVSTDVPAARRLAPAVAIAGTHGAFIAALRAALTDRPDQVRQRLAIVRPHSWAARVDHKVALVRAALARAPYTKSR